MLCRTMVNVQPGKAQRRMSCNLRGKQSGGFPRCNPAPVTDVDLDIDIDHRTGLRRRTRQSRHGGGVVGQDPDPRPACELSNARRLGFADHLVGDHDIADACVDKNCRLANFLTANSDCALGDLAVRDVRRLVTFGVSPQANIAAIECAHHPLQIALKGIKIEHQRGRINIGQCVTRPGGIPWTHLLPLVTSREASLT